METKRPRIVARVLLALLSVGALSLLLAIRPHRVISTDVLDLIPRDERSPELALVRSLASEEGAKVALFALEVPGTGETRAAAVRRFCEVLRASPSFSEVEALRDSAMRESLGREIFRQRLNLMLPSWLQRHWTAYQASRSQEPWPKWLANRTAEELRGFLDRPESLAFQDLIPADPLLLVPGLADSLGALEPSPADAHSSLLVWAKLSQSPLREEGQQPVFGAVASALDEVHRIAPSASLRWTSIARFAAANRQRIESELSILNSASLAVVILVACLFLRRIWRSLNLVPVVAGSVLFAWTATLLVFPQVHVLVFAVGALLTGVAVDYGFYIYLQPPLFPGEPYSRKALRLLRPMLSSALTAIIGFSLLLFSELPLIRQLGVFVSAGLLGSVLFSFLWFAQVSDPYMETRAAIRYRLPTGPRSRAAALWIVAVGACVCVFGVARLRWHDDIRELEIPAPGLTSETRDVRALFGDSDGRSAYLTYGTDLRSARDSLERFCAWHKREYPNSSLQAAGLILPTTDQWRILEDAHARLSGFSSQLSTALAANGFESDAFAAFYEQWNLWASKPLEDYDSMARDLAAGLHGPLQTAVSLSPGRCTLISIADHPPDREPPPELSTTSANQLENLNNLFARYRKSALRLSLLGLLLLGASVLALYGPLRGLSIFAIPAGACLFAFGLLGIAGGPLNLFHLLGAFLGVCLSHNYAIFSAENRARGEDPPPSIRLSALCTAASFGVLTLSHIPVVAALGMTVSLIVVSAMVIVEVKLLLSAPGDLHP